jgi:hypothetical protein
MNMVAPEYGDPQGRLDLSTYNYQLTTSALKHWDYTMAEGLKFKDVRDLVLSYGRERYRFSGGGSGCRYWW